MRTIGRIIRGIIFTVLGYAVFIALMRAFGWDVFGIVEWTLNVILWIGMKLGDIFQSPIQNLTGHFGK